MHWGRGSCQRRQEGCPIRRSPDQRLLAAPRSLSQLATSFIAGRNRGIHTTALGSLTTRELSARPCSCQRARATVALQSFRRGESLEIGCARPLKPAKNGGPERDRTADLLNANQALSQLSYRPRHLRNGRFSSKSKLVSAVGSASPSRAVGTSPRLSDTGAARYQLSLANASESWWAEQELHL